MCEAYMKASSRVVISENFPEICGNINKSLKVITSISQLPNLFRGTPRICNCILLLIVWVRSFSKTFAEEKVLIFLIIREKC